MINEQGLARRQPGRALAGLVLVLSGCLSWRNETRDVSADAGAEPDAAEPDAAGSVRADAEVEPTQDATAEVGDASALDDAGPEEDGATEVDAGSDAGPAGPCPQSACPDVFPCEGTEHDFICRGQFAEFPIPLRRSGQDYAEQKLVVDEDVGVVLDQISGLMWARNVFPSSITQAEAVTYCNDLVLPPYEDFRLASLHEYVTLFGSELAPDLDSRAFPGAATTFGWWSSTPAVEPTTRSFYAIAYNEYAFTSWPETYGQGAHCVRTDFRPIDVHDTPATRFVERADGKLLHDTHTGLVWEAVLGLAQSSLSFAQSEAYCRSLDYLGLAYRVPTIAELMSIMDLSKPRGQRFGTPFRNQAWVTWTRSKRVMPDDSVLVWQLHEEGWIGTSGAAPTDQAGVRCVATAP